MLDENYYKCIENGKQVIDDISILGPEYILLFKARAWLDLTQRKGSGEPIDSKNIKKHRNDVFRIFGLLSPDQRIDLAGAIKADLSQFIETMLTEQNLDLKSLGIRHMKLEDLLQNLKLIYQLEP